MCKRAVESDVLNVFYINQLMSSRAQFERCDSDPFTCRFLACEQKGFSFQVKTHSVLTAKEVVSQS